MDFFRHFTGEAPDELTAYFSLFGAPGEPAETLAVIAVCHCGDAVAADRDLKPLREPGPPLADTIQAMPYPVINTLSDAGYPRGALNYWKSAFFASLGQEALEIMVDAVRRCPSPMSGLSIMPYLAPSPGCRPRPRPSRTGRPATAVIGHSFSAGRWPPSGEGPGAGGQLTFHGGLGM